MGTRIIIATNCCTNCRYEGDSFTNGTFHCEWDDEYLNEEKKDCPDYEMKDFDEDNKED